MPLKTNKQTIFIKHSKWIEIAFFYIFWLIILLQFLALAKHFNWPDLFSISPSISRWILSCFVSVFSFVLFEIPEKFALFDEQLYFLYFIVVLFAFCFIFHWVELFIVFIFYWFEVVFKEVYILIYESISSSNKAFFCLCGFILFIFVSTLYLLTIV